MTCGQLDEYRVIKLVDGSLDPSEIDSVTTHVDNCPQCRDEAGYFRALIGQIQELASSLPEPIIPTRVLAAPNNIREAVDISTSDLTDEFIETLAEAIHLRQFAIARTLIEPRLPTLVDIDSSTPNAARFLDYAARWIDMGFPHTGVGLSDIELVEMALRAFPSSARFAMSLSDYVHLKMAEGHCALNRGHYDAALACFEAVLAVRDDLLSCSIGQEYYDLIASALSSTGKTYGKQGLYQDAERYIDQGLTLLEGRGSRDEMRAAMSISKAWFMFQDNRPSEAEQILITAEQQLLNTDDYLRLGHIRSAMGRIKQRHGDYHKASKAFNAALQDYRCWGPTHPHIARTLSNLAFAKRLLALQFETENGLQGPGGASEDARFFNIRRTVDTYRREAHAHLDAAEKIYDQYPQTTGLGTVMETRAFLELDAGNARDAKQCAEKAFDIGHDTGDHILMARSKILQCMIIVALDAPTPHNAELALSAALDSIEYANSTHHRRVIGRAHLWRAVALLQDHIGNVAEAHTAYRNALSSLGDPGKDYLWHELRFLSSRLDSYGVQSSALLPPLTVCTNADRLSKIDKDGIYEFPLQRRRRGN